MSVKTVKNKTLIIGITGGVATGKSSVSNILKEEGEFVISCDEIVAKLWENPNIIKKGQKLLSMKQDLTINKKEVFNIIFNNKEKRELLNDFIHPLVFDKINETIKNNPNKKIYFIDMPLLYEVGYQDQVDYVLLVYANENLQKSRLIKNRKLNEEDAKKLIDSQIPINIKLLHGDFVIYNENDLKTLKKQIIKTVKEIKNEFKI